MEDWWAPARERALADLRRTVSDKYHLRGDEALTRFLAHGWPQWAADERDRIMSPGWLPDRKRRMTPLWRIASYWAARGIFGDPGDWPYCFRCGQRAPCETGSPASRWNGALGYLERAHLVDHWLGGLDGPQNIVPLCRPCHRAMPMFGVGDGPKAIEWVLQA